MNLTSSRRNYAFLMLGILAIFAISTFFINQRWMIGISESDSMPHNILIVDKKDKAVKKGDVVGFIYQGEQMYHYKKGAKFIKYLVCDEGDKLKVESRKYYCNNTYIGEAITINSHGDAVVNFKFNGIVPQGKFFSYTPAEYSYDSRYWGFADKKDIIGKGFGVL